MFIECGIINYKIIIPFVYPLIFGLREFLEKGNPNNYYRLFNIYLCHLLGGIVYGIIKCTITPENFPIYNLSK